MDKSISIFKSVEYENLFLNFFIDKIKEEYDKNDLFFCFGNLKGVLNFEEVIDPDLCLSWFIINFLKFNQEMLSKSEGAILEINLYNYPIIDVDVSDEVELSSILKNEFLMQAWFDALIDRLAFEKSLDFLSDDLDLINIDIDRVDLTRKNGSLVDVYFEDSEVNDLFNGVCSIFVDVNKKYNATKNFTFTEIKCGMINSFLGCSYGELEKGVKLNFYKCVDGGFSVNVKLFTSSVKDIVINTIKNYEWLNYCIDFTNNCGMGVLVKEAKDFFELIYNNNVVLTSKDIHVLDDLVLFNKLEERMHGDVDDVLLEKIIDNLTVENKNNYIHFDGGYSCNWDGQKIVFPLNLIEGEVVGEDIVNFIMDELINKNSDLLGLKQNIKSLMGLMILVFLKNKNVEMLKRGVSKSVTLESYNWAMFSDYWINDVGFSSGPEKLKIMLKKIYELGILYEGKKVEPTNIYKILILAEYLKDASLHTKDLFLFDIDAIKKRSIRSVENPVVEHYLIIALEEGLWKKTIDFIDFDKMILLKNRFPNFKEVLDYYIGAFKIYLKNGFLPSPVLLIGDPGLGKTDFSNKLAECININFLPLQMSSLTAGWIIGGGSSQWKDSKHGIVANALLTEDKISSLIMLDEIDKVNSSGKQFDPFGSLYSLLESATAKSFSDEFLELHMDASHLIWIATANSLHNIPAPILDRFVVFEVKKASKEETKNIVKNIFSDLTKNLDVELLSDEVMNYLTTKTPRDIKRILRRAIANAANRNNLIQIYSSDVKDVEKNSMHF